MDGEITRLCDDPVDGCLWGDVAVMLDHDDNLCGDSWKDSGYCVEPLLSAQDTEEVVNWLRDFVLKRLREVLGERLPKEARVEDFHLYATDEDQQRAYDKLKGPHPFEELPHSEAFVKRMSELCGTEVEPFLGGYHIRICRPDKEEGVTRGDNNPWHRDVYLSRLRNKVNTFVPIGGCSAVSSLYVIPRTHTIPESHIYRTPNGATVNGKKYTVPAIAQIRGKHTPIRPNPSSSEVLGIDVVSFKTLFSLGFFPLVFSPYLVHGNSNNAGSETRFSMEARWGRPKPPHPTWPQVCKLG